MRLWVGNGSTFNIAKNVFDALGAKTYVVGNEPDGTNINMGCGSTHIENLHEALNGAGNGASSFGRTAGSSFSTVLNLSKKLDSGFKKLGNGIASIIKKFASLRNASAKSHLGMQKDLKKTMRMVLQWGFGIRSVYFLIRRLRSTFVTGMNTLATQFPEINSQLSALTRSFHEMKASLTTAFQPIASYVIPLLIKLMDYISAAARAVGSFFAVLTGQKYIYKATAAEKDYAESITGTGNAAEEAEDKLASYDKLDVIDKDKDKSSGSGSKGNIFDDVTFEKVDVGGAISKFAESLFIQADSHCIDSEIPDVSKSYSSMNSGLYSEVLLMTYCICLTISDIAKSKIALAFLDSARNCLCR